MKKKIFGIKLSTIFTVFACLVIAFAIWIIVKYRANINATAALAIPLALIRG